MSERIEKSYFSGNPKGDGQPYPKIPNRAAQALGRLAAGKPKLWHALSCAAWDRFGLDSEASRKRCAAVRAANAKTYLKSIPRKEK